MTSPVIRGFPDYSPQYSGLDQELINVTARVINGVDVFPRVYVGNTRRIGVRFANLNAAAEIQFRAFRTLVDVTPMIVSAFDLNSGMSVERSVACPGPYVEISIVSPVGVPLTYDLRVWQTPIAFDHRATVNDSRLISSIGTAIAAGGVANPTATNHHVGQVFWNAYCSGPAWSAQLLAVLFDGTNRVVDKTTNVEGRAARFAYLPQGYGIIRVTNNDAVGQTYDAILVAQPDPGH